MRLNPLPFITLFLLFNTTLFNLTAQNGEQPNKEAEALWLHIEAQLAQQTSDTAFYFMLPIVRAHCSNDYKCLDQTYYRVMKKLESQFKLRAAIFIVDEMVKIAKKEGDMTAEAKAYRDLYRFHDAIGNKRLGIINLDKALALFEKVGKNGDVAKVKMAKLETSLSYDDKTKVIADMNALLAQTVKDNDTSSTRYIHLRMVLITLDNKNYEDAERHIAALEKIRISNPCNDNEFYVSITALRGRADLLRALNKLNEAVLFYKKGLILCEACNIIPDEIGIYNSLAALEWGRGNAALAKSYLDKVESLGITMKADDYLVVTYALKAQIAEKEGDYKKAFESLKLKYDHDEQFKARSAGFDVQSYYLQLEKDQLETEKVNKSLELSLKNTQLFFASSIAALILMLAAGLLVGYRKQRDGSRKLTMQNTLIQKQAEDLQSLDVAKMRFFANISHELRTPLTLILGNISSVVKRNGLDNKDFTNIKTAQSNAKTLLKLVNEILDLSKLESGKMQLLETTVPFYPFLRRLVSAFESHAERLNIRYQMEYRADQHLRLAVDVDKVTRIVYNLLSNAFKFTSKGGSVKVIVEDKAESIRLTVSDTGRGIHPNDLPHVFNRFYQTQEANAPIDGGTGIGLALCKEFAQVMAGHLSMESTVGSGSQFYFTFPKKEVMGIGKGDNELIELEYTDSNNGQDSLPRTTVLENKETNNTQTNGQTHSLAKTATVLLVEDNAELRAYIADILRGGNLGVLEAENGQTALDMLHHTQPQLIISDIMMPVMDGFQLLETLKASDVWRSIPVVMLTARADIRDKLTALRIGVDDYLIKPFEEDELLARVHNLLNNYQKRQILSPALPESDKADEQTRATSVSQEDTAWLQKQEQLLATELANENFSATDWAAKIHLSERQLQRKLKELTGLSPYQYLIHLRLTEARNLLEDGSFQTVAEVAYQVGFSNPNAFSRNFQKQFGRLPSTYF